MLSIRSQAAIEGPNIWNRSPVTYVVVEADTPLDISWEVPLFAGWEAALVELVHQGTSLEPLSGTGPADLGTTLARTALDLQRIAGVEVEFCFGRPRPVGGGYDVVVQHQHQQVGLAAVSLAVRWLDHLIGSPTEPFDLLEAFERFLVVVETSDHGVIGRAIANAAARRGIPREVVDPRGRIVEYGNGRYRKRVTGISTSFTSMAGVEISRDKSLTSRYLREAGLPVPAGVVVRSVDQAVNEARTIGYPVVVKPLDLGGFEGISLDLRNDDEVRTAFASAAAAGAKGSGKVLVERFVRGNDYRVNVVDDRVIAVSERIHPQIAGDGAHTVRQLIETENADPRRGTRWSDVYKKIVIDELVLRNLARLELSLDDVPALGQRIELIASSSRQDGVIYVDRTDDIHPENSALARMAARVVGLDIAGIDVIATDIAQPMLETGGAIIEVNDNPAFNIQLFPGAGPSRDLGPAMMEMLFPPGQPVRVPVVAVTESEESTQVCVQLGRILSDDGGAVGLATRVGVTVAGMRFPSADARNPAGPRTLLNNPTVEAAVVEVDAESIVGYGLGFDVCDVAVVLALSGLETPYGLPVETVLLNALDAAGMAILNGSDPAVRALADRCPGAVVFADTAEAAVLAATECLGTSIGHGTLGVPGPL
jgi:cyanophycin synthetase